MTDIDDINKILDAIPIAAPLNVVVIYVYPNMGGLHDDLATRFVKYYTQFKPAMDHKLVIVSNGGPPTAAALDILRPLQYQVLMHDDTGWDIGAYQKAARTIPCDLMVFFGGTSFPKGPGWLERMVAAYRKHGPAIYGATGSLGHNIHIRTTGFWLDPSLFNAYPHPVTSERDSRYAFEHGKQGLTMWAIARGLKAWVVTWTGEYEWQQWDSIPNGFQRGDQSALLVGDRLTEPPYYPPERAKIATLAKQRSAPQVVKPQPRPARVIPPGGVRRLPYGPRKPIPGVKQ